MNPTRCLQACLIVTLVALSACANPPAQEAPTADAGQIGYVMALDVAMEHLGASAEPELSWASMRENRLNDTAMPGEPKVHDPLWLTADPETDGRAWGWLLGFETVQGRMVAAVHSDGLVRTSQDRFYTEAPVWTEVIERGSIMDSTDAWAAIQMRPDVQDCLAHPAEYFLGWVLHQTNGAPAWHITLRAKVALYTTVSSGQLVVGADGTVDGDGLTCPVVAAQAVWHEVPGPSVPVMRFTDTLNEDHQVLNFAVRVGQIGPPVSATLISPNGDAQKITLPAGGHYMVSFEAGPITAGEWTLQVEGTAGAGRTYWVGWCAAGMQSTETAKLCDAVMNRD